jgi:hypothetical protein
MAESSIPGGFASMYRHRSGEPRVPGGGQLVAVELKEPYLSQMMSKAVAAAVAFTDRE